MPLKTISVSDFPHNRPSYKQQRQMQKVSDNFTTLAPLVLTVGDGGGLVGGNGSSSARYAMGTTADKSMLKFYGDALNTSGFARILDARLYFGGIGGEGEAVRAYAIVNGVQAAVGGTVNGGHSTLQVQGAGGQVSGAGNAHRFSLAIGASCNPGGTLAGIQIDSQFNTSATVPAGVAAVRINDTDTKKWSYALRVPAIASGGLLAAHITDGITHSIRCIDENGQVFYVMCTTTASNRTGGA